MSLLLAILNVEGGGQLGLPAVQQTRAEILGRLVDFILNKAHLNDEFFLAQVSFQVLFLSKFQIDESRLYHMILNSTIEIFFVFLDLYIVGSGFSRLPRC